MRALLDVNVLLALFDLDHIFHAKASAWWHEQEQFGWASSPTTQSGVLRIASGGSYPNRIRLADAIAILRQWAVPPLHAFWSDDLSLLDPSIIDHDRLLGPRQITDAYLLALAVRNSGRLATFDKGISLGAVKGAKVEHLAVIA